MIPVLVLLLVIVLGGLVASLYFWNSARQRVKALEAEFAEVVDVWEERRKIEGQISAKTTEFDALTQRIAASQQELGVLREEVRALDEEAGMQSFGLYTPHYNFSESGVYAHKIKEIRDEQKNLIKAGRAAVCHQAWTVDGSKKKGEAMMKRRIKLILRAFNGECDAAIGKVKYNNVEVMEKRIEKSRDAINKIVSNSSFEITQAYYQLKLQELWLVHEHREKKQQEAEEQKRIKEQMREEAQAAKELEKAQREAQREEDAYKRALEVARKQLEGAQEAARADLSAQIAELEKQLAEAHEKNQRAISQAQLTRSGHVYIISNIGSFGEGVYKIGLTRRLEPIDRVKELGGASVPFTFDVHAMIYSKDAPALENALHKLFDAKRVNRVNSRKEYFRVSLEEIEEAVKENFTEEVEFTYFAEAEEYRKSSAIFKEEVASAQIQA